MPEVRIRTAPGKGLLLRLFKTMTASGKVDGPRLAAPDHGAIPPSYATLCSSDEVRLAAIWVDLLRLDCFGLDDDFFDLGGHSILVARLQRRIFEEFGLVIPVLELFKSPTVRRQAQILQPHGTGDTIFWVNLVKQDFASAIGEEHPLFSLVLTAEDIASLGESPNVRDIAICLKSKVVATQPKGPYILGVLCASAVLAFEIASLVQVAGHEVSLLVLLDPPYPTRAKSFNSSFRGLSYGAYYFKRAARLGLPTSLSYFGEHLLRGLAAMLRVQPTKTELRAAQETMEAAVHTYQPKSYCGNVLLILPSERPCHQNFLPGWQSVLPRNLHILYSDGNHRELLDANNLDRIAERFSHLLRT